eukprot:43671-Chlamydomonas_euryale.AAC.2
MDALDTEGATYFKQVAVSGGYGSMLRDTEWQGTAFLPTNEVSAPDAGGGGGGGDREAKVWERNGTGWEED